MRLEPQAYERWSRERPSSAATVGIVGAGVAGLACARTLAERGVPVKLFEKGPRPGGRVATRERDGWEFDHGAQFFTARDPAFRHLVDEWRGVGLVATWNPRVVALGAFAGRRGDQDADGERFVAVPRMQALAAHLAAGLEVASDATVTRVGFKDGQWHFFGEGEADLGGFDYAVLAVPAPQAAALVEGTTLAMEARAVLMAPCWTVLAGYEEALDLPFDAAYVSETPLAWLARNASKPGRPARETWVLQASPDWSMANLEEDADLVRHRLVDCFAALTGSDAVHRCAFAAAHRWRYALATTHRVEPCLFEPHLWIGLCGDWCGGARVEGAFLSGRAMASRLLEAM